MGDIREFITRHEHQRVYLLVSSNGINFEIKGKGKACIGLGVSRSTTSHALITLEDHRCTIGVRDETRDLTRDQTFLSVNEFRHFWISWDGSAINLGENGCGNPILTFVYKASDLKYVELYSTRNERTDSVLHWKVELPPVKKKPPLKAISGGELHWVPIDTDTDVLPDGSLIGGYEKEMLYIIRAKHRGSLTPGKFVPSEGSAYIPWGGEMNQKDEYEVLCGYDCTWVSTFRDNIPLGAVVAGHSENIEHEKLYVGRAKHLNHIIPGKVQPSHKVCYVPYDGREIAVKTYEILVVTQRDKYINTIPVQNEDFDDDYDIEVNNMNYENWGVDEYDDDQYEDDENIVAF